MPENKKAPEFVGASQYRLPFSFELAGKVTDLVFDDGKELLIQWLDGSTMSYSENGAPAIIQKYECLKAENNIYLILSEKPNSSPREAMILVLDLAARLVTGNFVKQGALSAKPHVVTREVRFGYIDAPGKPVPADRHAFTEDLVGKKIRWTYNPTFDVVHVYRTPTHYRWAFSPKTRKNLPADGKLNKDFVNKLDEPCIYIKINDHMYVFSWIEEEGSGTEGFALMNVDRMNDVGCFWGNNPDGGREAYMFSAYGEVIKEHLPEED